MTNDKIKFTQDALEALRHRLREHRENTMFDGKPMTWKVLAGMMGAGESTLFAFASGNYNGDNQKIAETVARWFHSAETVELFAEDWVPGYQATRTAQSIHANLTWAARGKMITIIGDPGLGKTFALRNYTEQHKNTWLVTAEAETSTPLPFLKETLDAMQVSAGGARSSYDLLVKVRKVLTDRSTPLLIVDEAQHLAERTLEQLRGLHDKTGAGIVLCGNHEVTRKVDGTRTANFAQRSSRISTRPIYAKPHKDDVAALLVPWGIKDSKEIDFLMAIAMKPGGGALRQMTQVLDKATLLAFGAGRVRDLADLRDAAAEANVGVA